MAGGETWHSRWGMREPIETRAIDIIQPDICGVGGFTEIRRVADMAALHGIRLVPHVWGTAVQIAASLQFMAAMVPNPVLLANYLAKQVELGRLKPIDDPMYTSRQIGDLCMAGLYRPRLFGEMQAPPPREKVERNVEWAVRLFMNTYGTDKS